MIQIHLIWNAKDRVISSLFGKLDASYKLLGCQILIGWPLLSQADSLIFDDDDKTILKIKGIVNFHEILSN